MATQHKWPTQVALEPAAADDVVLSGPPKCALSEMHEGMCSVTIWDLAVSWGGGRRSAFCADWCSDFSVLSARTPLLNPSTPIRVGLCPRGVVLDSEIDRNCRSGGYSLATAFGVPLRTHRVATGGGLPTGIFMSHLLRQKGTYGLVGH